MIQTVKREMIGRLPTVTKYNSNFNQLSSTTGFSPEKSCRSLSVQIEKLDPILGESQDIIQSPTSVGSYPEQPFQREFETLQLLATENNKDYERRIDQPDVKIDIAMKSQFSSKVPIARATFVLQKVNPSQLYKILYDPKIRLQWDSDSLLDYVEFEAKDNEVSYYMCNKAPWPLRNRDFVESRVTQLNEDDSIHIYCYNKPNDLYPEFSNAERGQTIYAGQTFTETGENECTAVFISQVDVKGSLSPMIVRETLPISLLKWKSNLEKAIKTYVN